MPINSRSKGANGEREVKNMLNDWVDEVRVTNGFELIEPPFIRNQNQSAVGGFDLTNPFKLAIEVKFYKEVTLTKIDKWWEQTLRQTDDGYVPVLIYKQNRGKWRVRMYGSVWECKIRMVCDVSIEDFETWFKRYYLNNHCHS